MPRVTRAGVGLHYEVQGEGTPVLFHTGGGGDWQMWQRAGYLDQFADCRLVLMDHRGHGRSDSPTGVEAHRPDEYDADVLAVLDDAGVEAAAFIGYSGGAYRGFRVATRHPERVLALVALGYVPTPPSDADDEGLREMAAAVRGGGTRSLMEQFSASEREPAPSWLIENLSATSEEMFALNLEADIGSTPLWELLPTIRCPVLMVYGTDEADDTDAAAACERIPKAAARSLPDYGHLQAFWHGEVTAPIMVDWLRAEDVLP